MTQRTIREIRPAHAGRDGDGVAIQRVAGMRHAGMDPILMLDELRSEFREDFAGGFPPHPHRGMQTLTYMKRGGIVHEDSRGNRGEIRGGGAQWMSAGRGIIHSEMPTQDTQGLHGFQLWVNLPAAEKMSAPRYRDIPAAELATWSGEGFTATAVAGAWTVSGTDATGPLRELAPRAGVLDLELQAGASAALETGAGHSVMAYIYGGGIAHGGEVVPARHMLITGAGEQWMLQAGPQGARLLVLRGTPLREPVAHYGPFVMNTPEEIEQAIRDYQEGRFA
ncbi:pirin family protein [Parahaliea mediterranea]|uniref:Pirin family protein n=1 Tax=Parahaliea mediterranea TaxID=651086 RepID=A0A939DDM6_9GAMM|nr:pirin family protein [Parahaliea mediterranea]MBN7795637.1 pirin family protein [Parahaliea mediterranea]